MIPELRDLAVSILEEHRIMVLATSRADGWPQATVVGYANDGLKLYCFVARVGQKFANIARDPRVSVAIGRDAPEPNRIRGLSLAGKAIAVSDKIEFDRGCDIFMNRYPEYRAWPRPNPAISPMLCITPMVMSLLDYSKGFGHSEVVKVSAGDLNVMVGPTFHEWFGPLK